MKPELRRIETTLNQLRIQHPTLSNQVTSEEHRPQSHQTASNDPLYASFTMRSSPQPRTPPSEAAEHPLDLPNFDLPNFNNHHHIAEPGLAMGLLKEMEDVVAGWQVELQQVLIKIQEIYLEGPVINGWLESEASVPYPSKTSHAPTAAAMRHAEVDRLMDYVNTICATQPPMPNESSLTSYRLCGLDEDGQLWSRPCPPEQVPYVSLAIARYQKLRQLLEQQKTVESRLTQFAQELIALRSRLK